MVEINAYAPLTAAACFAFRQTRRASTSCACPPWSQGWFLISQAYVFLSGLHGKPFFHAHFFKKFIHILWQNAFPVVVGSRGRNTHFYGKSRAWVVRARFYRGAIIRCPLILSHRNLVGECLPKTLVKKYGNDFNGSPSLKWAGFFSVLGRKERQNGGSKKILKNFKFLRIIVEFFGFQ